MIILKPYFAEHFGPFSNKKGTQVQIQKRIKLLDLAWKIDGKCYGLLLFKFPGWLSNITTFAWLTTTKRHFEKVFCPFICFIRMKQTLRFKIRVSIYKLVEFEDICPARYPSHPPPIALITLPQSLTTPCKGKCSLCIKHKTNIFNDRKHEKLVLPDIQEVKLIFLWIFNKYRILF